MKNKSSFILHFCLLMIGFAALSGCGQKGPLEVDRTPAVQEEELEETK